MENRDYHRSFHVRIVRDPVHGYISLPSDVFETLIDTPVFQRLRDIKQLGLTHMVYPGAMHTRFEHSLGAAHIVNKLIEAIIENTRVHVIQDLKGEDYSSVRSYLEEVLEELRQLRKEAVVAALLHDIGHMMLSHIFEAAIRDYLHLAEGRVPAIRSHEELTLRIIEGIAEEEVLFEGEKVDMNIVEKILKQAYRKEDEKKKPSKESKEISTREAALRVIAELISSDADVDRADYILRDSYHAGSVEGLYDLERLYSVAVLAPIVKEDSRQGISRIEEVRVGVVEKGVTVVENMLLARIYMYNDVYLHTVSTIYSGMAARLIALVYTMPRTVAETLPGGGCIHDIVDKKARGEAFTQCILELTDTTFNQLVREATRLPHHGAKYYDALLEKGVPEDKACKILASLYLLAQALIHRRHWSAYIVEGGVAATIAEELKEGTSKFIKVIEKYIDPMVIVTANSYEAYKGTPQAYIPVYLREYNFSIQLHRSPLSMIASEVRGRSYAKAAIIFPPPPHPTSYTAEPLTHWNLRSGKTLPRKAVDEAGKLCRESQEKVLKHMQEAGEKARKMAEELAWLASRKTPPR